MKHGTAPVGSLEWSDQVTRRKYFVEPHIIDFAQFWRWKDKWVLEIGCGIGTDTLQFIKAGAYIFAVDSSQKSIDLAIQRAVAEKLDLISTAWRSLDAEEVLPTICPDLVYSFGVLHHTTHPEKVLKLVHKIIAGDGELRIMLYAKYSLKHLLGTQPEAQAGCPLVKWYSAREARWLLSSCGFRVVSIHKAHIFPWRIRDYVQHRYVKHWFYRWMPGWMFRALERIAGHHLLLVARKA